MDLRKKLVRELVENAEDNEFRDYEHHAEQDRKHSEINVSGIFLIRGHKKTGYYSEYS